MKLGDIIIRLEWFIRQCNAIRAMAEKMAQLQRKAEAETAFSGDMSNAEPELAPFLTKYKAISSNIADQYGEGSRTLQLMASVLHDSGAAYATAEGEAHRLVQEVNSLLRNY